MAIQICVITALREVPTKLLMRRFCLIHLKKVSICQRVAPEPRIGLRASGG